MTVLECARSLLRTSSSVFASKSATLPDSCPVRIRSETCARVHTVGFEPIGLNSDTGSRDSDVKMLDSQRKKQVILDGKGCKYHGKGRGRA